VFILFIGEESHPIEQRYAPVVSQYWENFNDYYRTFLLVSSEIVLNMMQYKTTLINNYVLKINGYNGIGLGNYCLGFQLMYYFSMLIAVSELSVRTKVFGIITGIVATTILNILRISGLNLMTVYAPNWMFLSHDYIFNFIVFGVLMLFYYKLVN
jgi:exosortase/archaeosortase family protein